MNQRMDANGCGHICVAICLLLRGTEVPVMLKGAGEDKPMVFIVSYPCEEAQAGKGENGKSPSL